MRLKSFGFGLPVVLASVVFCGAMRGQDVAFGGIELASSSVKGITFVFQPGAETTAAGVDRPERMKRLQYAERNASFVSMRDGCKLSEKGIELLAKDTREVIDELREGAKDKSLGALQLYAVASSGLGSVCNKEEITAKLQEATGLCAEFITASDEAKFSLGFVMPKDRYRSLILDVGGGNVKAGYYVVTKGANWPPKEWHGLELAYGSRTLKDAATALMKTPQVDAEGKPKPALTFYQAVDVVLEKEVLPQLRDLKVENSALENFPQVYLMGGAVWATSARSRPVQQQEWAINSLTLADFDKVLGEIRDGTYKSFDGTEFGARVSAKTREGAENELQDVLQRFDMQSLYAGVSLARFAIEHTTPDARLYFPTTAAWISGYARERFKETGKAMVGCPIPQAYGKAAAGF